MIYLKLIFIFIQFKIGCCFILLYYLIQIIIHFLSMYLFICSFEKDHKYIIDFLSSLKRNHIKKNKSYVSPLKESDFIAVIVAIYQFEKELCFDYSCYEEVKKRGEMIPLKVLKKKKKFNFVFKNEL
ncbi:hypothetical protein RFI_33908 [Reticulomyxa filosa]|uniref:Uncharacterized protein n=1 Tax=Reticulomyxa filosa TaxID=46433 RepID=X6LQT1_RETFI|nr:hypothetical protein RFI_33908 [Reticulomyxa filosa]|eukprot:ETO03497.1 hypothetical protein RFI_33908 [Reticulomyxa filosa]